MHYRGKLIGFLVGLWLGNLVGAILGLWLGHLYDVGMRRQRGFGFRRMPGKVEQALFFHTTFAVMGHIAKAAGRVSEQQIRIATLFMDRMQLKGELRREAQESFRQGKDPAYPLEQELASFRRTCRGQMDLLRVFMEIQMQAAFAELMQGKTVVVIAHRLSTITDADCIYVVDGGKVVQSGTHEQLVAQAGLYAHMWEAHMGAQDWSLKTEEAAC